jgi:hypothetical protein
LDDTCITTPTMLGTTPWWEYFIRQVTVANFDIKTTFCSVFPLVGKILGAVPVVVSEEEIPLIIRAMQEQHVLIWGLTGRFKNTPYDLDFAITTRDQLQRLGIDFEAVRTPSAVHMISSCKSDVFAHGIVFTSQQLKGPVIKKFLEEIQYHPIKVVMVDDMRIHLESAEEVLKSMNIPFEGFHYTRHADSNAAFDPLIGNLQLKALLTQGYVPNNEQTSLWKSELLKTRPDLSPDFCLDEIIMSIKNR